MKKLNIKNILVPVDFSDLSIQAVDAANKLAKRFGGNVHLVHVFDEYYSAGFDVSPAGPIGPIVYPSNIAGEIRTKRSRDLTKIAARFGIAPTNVCLRDGMPAFDEICRLAQEISTDLIVMPTHGRTGLKHVLVGSTAERVVQHSPCPVFIYRKAAARIDKIIVPVDFSVPSFHALKEAIAIAGRTAAKIIVLHVVELDLGFPPARFGVVGRTEIVGAWTNVAALEMSSFVRETKFGNVKFDTRIEVGTPVVRLCHLAEEEKADLIVTATHGRTGLKHMLMGSVAEKIVRHAPCSVLVVPTHPAERLKRIGKAATRPRFISLPSRRGAIESELITKRARKIRKHAFPERRKTNKFRESHLVASQ